MITVRTYIHVFPSSKKVTALKSTLKDPMQPKEVVYNTWFIVTFSQKNGNIEC